LKINVNIVGSVYPSMSIVVAWLAGFCFLLV